MPCRLRDDFDRFGALVDKSLDRIAVWASLKIEAVHDAHLVGRRA